MGHVHSQNESEERHRRYVCMGGRRPVDEHKTQPRSCHCIMLFPNNLDRFCWELDQCDGVEKKKADTQESADSCVTHRADCLPLVLCSFLAGAAVSSCH